MSKSEPQQQSVLWKGAFMVVRTILPAAFAAALMLVACSNAGTSFEDVDALAEELRSEGLACDGLSQPDINPQGEGLPSSSGSCSIDGEGVQLFTFPSENDATIWFEAGKMGTVMTARGVNWVVVTQTQDLADTVANALGGES